MTGLVIGKLGKLAHLWYEIFLLLKEEICPCECSFPWLMIPNSPVAFFNNTEETTPTSLLKIDVCQNELYGYMLSIL